jgi:perosamine synthetase
MKIPWWKIVFGAETAIAAYNAVKSGHMVLGPLTRKLEDRLAHLLGVKHVVGTCSGTAALTIALLEAGAGPGVDVLVPDQTWIATANAVMLTGARVIPVDVEQKRRLMDPAALEATLPLFPAAKIVIPVHLNGKAANMPLIREISTRYGLTVIEDAAQAFLSRSPEGGFLGTHSTAGCFSMSMGKILCTGQGGFVVTNNDERARRLRLARLHGTEDVYTGKWEMRGGNFRLWDLPAAIALQQLEMLERRREACLDIYRFYERELAGHERLHPVNFVLEKENEGGGEFPLYAECLCDKLDDFIEHMTYQGVQTRANYQPLHTVPHFHNSKFLYPNSDSFSKHCVILPCGPDRTLDELQQVMQAIKAWS